MIKRTEEEIKAAIERLKNNKEKTKQFNMFGEDNHKKIDAAIKVISENMSEDELYERYENSDEFEDEYTDCFDEAMSAYEWLTGVGDIEDLLFEENL